MYTNAESKSRTSHSNFITGKYHLESIILDVINDFYKVLTLRWYPVVTNQPNMFSNYFIFYNFSIKKF